MLKALTTRLAGKDRLGLMLGLLGSVERGMGVLAPLIGGPAYQFWGPIAPACLAAAFALVGVAAAAVWMESHPATEAEAEAEAKKKD